MQRSPKNPIFVLGYPRSGTTLLRALLGAHSQIHLVNEPGLVRGMVTAGCRFGDTIKRQDCAQLLEQLRRLGAGRQHLSTLAPERLSAFVNSSKDLTFKEVFEFLLPKPENVAVWGEKSLGNVFYIKELHKLYPKALFVHIIRDPRAALLSHYRKRFAQTAPCSPSFDLNGIRFFAQGAFLWRQWLDAVGDARESLGKNVVLQLRYRDLVTNPERQLRRICEVIGLDFEYGMLETSSRQEDPVLSPQNSGAYAHQNLGKPINSARATAYEELPDWASYIVEKYVGVQLRGLGFTPSPGRAGALKRMRVELEMLLAETKLRSKVDRDVADRRGMALG